MMKKVSRINSSKFSSCFRPSVDPPSSSLHRSSSFRTACLPLPPQHHPSAQHHPPKPALSLLIKALALQTRLCTGARPPSLRGSKRRSSGDGRPILNQATKASDIPETKSEPTSSCSSSNDSPSSCWSPGSESENSSKSSHSVDKESRREGKSEKERKWECSGTFMVVFSLTFTVMVGKYWGALLTSTCLYFFSLVKAGRLWPRKREGQIVEKSKAVIKEALHLWNYHEGGIQFLTPKCSLSCFALPLSGFRIQALSRHIPKARQTFSRTDSSLV